MYDEFGGGTGNDLGNYIVWTGTDETGATLNPLGGTDIRIGRADAVNVQWISNSTNPNHFTRSLYGISEAVTVVPEPGTALLLGSGLGLLSRVRRRECP